MSRYSFTAYIDESGDCGFVFKPDGTGSSRWLILSAVVVRRKNEPKLVELMRGIRTKLCAQPKQAPFLRTISVLIHKPSLREPERFQAEKDLLYRYACRYLLERVSWLCEKHHIEAEGTGLAEVIFSNRDQMSYEGLRDYLRLLRAGAAPGAQPMAWKHLDPDHVRAVQHSQLAGLQLADAVASGLYAAVTPNRFGDTEDRYARLLQPTFRRHKGIVQGFGLKFWPVELDAPESTRPALGGSCRLDFEIVQIPGSSYHPCGLPPLPATSTNPALICPDIIHPPSSAPRPDVTFSARRPATRGQIAS